MSRTLTAAVTTEVAKPVTAPGYFIEISFASPLRLSTRGTIIWSGNTWLTWNAQVGNLSGNASTGELSGSLELGNTDYTVSALVLGEGVANRAVKIWKFYGDAPATADPILVFSGVADSASFEPNSGKVTLKLVQTNSKALFAPRLYITPESGFNFLPAPGTIIDWDGERYELEEES